MCKKAAFKTINHAISGAISASRKTGKGMRPYPCPKCKKYHLSSKARGDFSNAEATQPTSS